MSESIITVEKHDIVSVPFPTYTQFFLENDNHKEPYSFIVAPEDFDAEKSLTTAREHGCYKFVVLSEKELSLPLWGVYFTKKVIGGELQEAVRIRVRAQIEEEDVGFCYMYIMGDTALFADLVVKEKYRSMGIGKQLVKRAEEETLKYDIKRIVGHSRSTAEKVQSWYERIGYVKEGFQYRINLLDSPQTFSKYS